MTGPHDPPYPGPQDPQHPEASNPQDAPSGPWQYPPAQNDPAQYPTPQYPPAPGYPPQGYEQVYRPGEPTPAPPGGRLDLAARLGDRLLRRPEPRTGAALAGAGAGLTIIGLLVWSFAYILEGLRDAFTDGPADTSRQSLGGVLFLALALLGYAAVVVVRRGPIATAGVVAGALSVPLSALFFSFDITSGPDIDATFWVSFIVWLVSYLFLPGARGRTFYLVAASYFLAVYVVSKVDTSALGDALGHTGIGSLQGSGDSGSLTSGSGGAGGLALAFGLAYYLAAWALDRRGRHGPALGFALAGFPVTLGGILALSPDLRTGGTGVALLVIGVALAWYGGSAGRRFTTWVWSLGALAGVALIVIGIVGTDSPDPVTLGVSLAVGGAVLVGLGVLVARVTGEPDAMVVAGPQGPRVRA